MRYCNQTSQEFPIQNTSLALNESIQASSDLNQDLDIQEWEPLNDLQSKIDENQSSIKRSIDSRANHNLLFSEELYN